MPRPWDRGQRSPIHADSGQIAVRADSGQVAVRADHQLQRDDDDRGNATVRRRAKRDLDAVPVREPPGDEQSQTVTAGRIEIREAGQVVVDRGQPPLGNSQATVLDLHSEPVSHHDTLDAHGRLGRRENSRVLDQLSQQVNDVRDGISGQSAAGMNLGTDSGVPLDLGHGGPDHVNEWHRLTPAAAGRVAGQDAQALGVPPHPRGEMVDTEQIRELLGFLGPSFHSIQQAELALQQPLAAPGQVAEDIVDAAPQIRLLHCGLYSGPVHDVERLPHLVDLVNARSSRRSFAVDVDLLTVPQPCHQAWELVVRKFQCRLTQAGQPAEQAAAHRDGDDHGRDDREQTDARGQDQGHQGAAGRGRHLRLDPVWALRQHALEIGGVGLHGALPLEQRHRRPGMPGGRRGYRVFQPCQGQRPAGRHVLLVQAVGHWVQLRYCFPDQVPADADELAEGHLVGR